MTANRQEPPALARHETPIDPDDRRTSGYKALAHRLADLADGYRRAILGVIPTLERSIELLGADVLRHEAATQDLTRQCVRLGDAVERLERRPTSVPPSSSLPPMRPSMDTHAIEALAEQVKIATIEGIERPDKTPEQTVQTVVARALVEHEAEKELLRLQAVEAQVGLDKAAESARLQLRRTARIKFFAALAVAIGGTVGADLIIRALAHL
jgi:hypothetical protein